MASTTPGRGLQPSPAASFAFALLAAIILGTMGLFLYRYPLHRMILRIDDHGVTLRSLGPLHDQPRSFIPFDRLEKITLHGDTRHPPWDVMSIDLRRGPGPLYWKFAALTATGTTGAEIARDIAQRAEAAGVQVTRTKGSRLNARRIVWHFSREADDNP